MKKVVSVWSREHSRPFDPSMFGFNLPDSPVKRRPSQLASNELLMDSDFGLDWRPTGSGKGYAIRFDAVHNAIKHLKTKIIVATPGIQTCMDFLKPMRLEFSVGNVKLWNPTQSTLNEDVDSSVQHILDFFTNEVSHTSHNDRIMITTHASLVRAHEQSPELFKSTLIFIDEAHHILYDTENEDEDEDETLEMDNPLPNKLGLLVKHAIQNPKDGIRLHFSTATFKRGDRRSIILEEHAEKLVIYSMPLSKYLEEECYWLKSFSYSFLLYKDSPMECLMEELKIMSKFVGYISSGDPKLKEGKVLDYIRAIAQSKKPRWVRNDNGTVSVFRKDKEYIGIILIEEKGRLEKYKYIESAHDGKVPLDFIICLRTFIEGSNLGTLEKSIIIGYKKSITDILQRVGRLTRDYKDKTHVEVVHILPQPFLKKEKNTSDKTVNKYNDYLKTILMVMEQMKVEFNIALPQRRSDKPASVSLPLPNLLMDSIGNNSQYDSIVEELTEDLLRLFTNGLRDDELVNEFKMSAGDILNENEIGGDFDAIIENFLDRTEAFRHKINTWNNGTSGLNLGVDVSELEFDIISDYKYVGHLLFLLTNKVDKKFLDRLRERVGETWDDMFQSVKKAMEK